MDFVHIIFAHRPFVQPVRRFLLAFSFFSYTFRALLNLFNFFCSCVLLCCCCRFTVKTLPASARSILFTSVFLIFFNAILCFVLVGFLGILFFHMFSAICFGRNTIGRTRSVPMWFGIKPLCYNMEFKTMHSVSNKFNKCNNGAVLYLWLSHD